MRKSSRVLVTSRSDVAVSISRPCCSIYRMLPKLRRNCVYFTRITTKVTFGYVENNYYLTFSLQTQCSFRRVYIVGCLFIHQFVCSLINLFGNCVFSAYAPTKSLHNTEFHHNFLHQAIFSSNFKTQKLISNKSFY